MLLTAAVFIALSECGIIPTDYISKSQKMLLYQLELLSVISTLGGTYLALRLFSFRRIKQQDFSAQKKWMSVRTAIIGCPVWINAVLYYASSYSTTPKYCLLVALTACVFCWPSSVGNEHKPSNPQ